MKEEGKKQNTHSVGCNRKWKSDLWRRRAGGSISDMLTSSKDRDISSIDKGTLKKKKEKILMFVTTKNLKVTNWFRKLLSFNCGGLSWLPWIHIKQERVIGYINRIFHHQCSHLVNYLDAPLRGKRFKWTPKGQYIYVMLETDGISSKFNRMARKLCCIEMVKYINSICRVIWAPSKTSY